MGNSFEAHYLRDLATSHSLHILGNVPIYHTSTSDSLLDVLLVDDPQKVLYYNKSDALFIAGHDLVCIHYQYSSAPSIERQIQRRNYANLDETELNNLIREQTHKLQDNFLPKCRPHWMTQEFKDKIRNRDKLYKRARRTQSILDFQIYRHPASVECCRNVTSATLNIAGNVAATFLQCSYVRRSATFRML
ncbi:hypothetical protein PV326_000090 [Microctonus aethiopoides]|nr:hypothetical protein PV326_000090 [Microctonus aethiopoides]